MFKKLAEIRDHEERVQIFNILNLNLALCLRLVEMLTLMALGAGLGWRISTPLMNALGFWPGAAASIALMLLMAALVRWPVLFMRSELAAAFHLDPRPAGARLAAQFKSAIPLSWPLWLGSFILFAGLVKLDILVWSALALGLGLVGLLSASFFPRLYRPNHFRPPLDGELPRGALARLEKWAPKTGLGPDRILISTHFEPELKAPHLSGLGPTCRLVIPQRALAVFTPDEMDILITSAVMGSLANCQLKLALLRFFSLAVAIPLASILISSLGVALWGYPLMQNPVLMALVWAGAWVGMLLSQLAVNLVRRSLSAQLDAVAAELRHDDRALSEALTTLYRKNLEHENQPAWQTIFSPRHGLKKRLDLVRYFRYMAQAPK